MHQSVSRIHAEIVVEPHAGPLAEVAPLAVRIVDRSSTGHTFISGRPSLGKNTPTPLADGDLLAFGVDPATYTLRWCPVVLSYSSRMPAQETQAMEQLARTAGAFLTPEWTQDCTHLLMEQLAITPKLLCCVADGGVPVAASYLRTLAACELGAPLPDPAAHRPRPPAGVDAAYDGKLSACFEAPKTRRSMLQGVWVIFGLRQAYDALSVALLHAGSQVHLLCTNEAQAAKVVEDLRRSVASHGPPKEVWLVPFLEERLGSLLSQPLGELGARCLTVNHCAVVSGILAGTLEAAHAEATPFQCQSAPSAAPVVAASVAAASVASFPETQRHQAQNGERPDAQGTRRAMPWNRVANGAQRVKEEEESFPNTLQQGDAGLGHVPAVASAAKAQPSLQMLPPTGGAAKRPAPDPGGEAPPPRRRALQPPEAARQPAQADGGTAVKDAKEPLDRVAGGRGEPGPVGGGLRPGSGTARSSTAPLPSAGAATIKSEPAGDEKPPVAARVFSTLTQGTSLSQAKNEPGFAAEQSSQKREVTELSQTKREPLQPLGRALAASAVSSRPAAPTPATAAPGASSSTARAAAASAQPAEPAVAQVAPEPVRHPTGVWLQSLIAAAPGRPGMDMAAQDMPRASWSTGVEVGVRKSPRAAASKVVNGARRGFKAFRKAPGQRARPGCGAGAATATVPLVPWAPALAAPLAEVFGSQAADSQSQLPPAI